MYYGLCRLSPVPATSDVWLEVGDLFDEDPNLADASDDEDEKPGATTIENV